MRLYYAGALLLLAAVWGSSFLFVRLTVHVLGPVLLVELRIVLSALALLAFAIFNRKSLTWHPTDLWHELRSRWQSYLLLGAFNCTFPCLLVAVAEMHITASLASILNAMTPCFGVMIAALWGQERFTVQKGIGLMLGLTGVGVLVGWSPIPLTYAMLGAVIACLMASSCGALGGVYSKSAFKHTPPLMLAIGQQTWAGLSLLPFALASPAHEVPAPHIWLIVLFMAVFASGCGYVVFFWLVQKIGSTSALSVAFLVPVFGVIWSTLFLNETLHGSALLGMLIIFGGLIEVLEIRPTIPKRLRFNP